VLALFFPPPEKFYDLRYEGVKRDTPPPAGSIAVVLAEVKGSVNKKIAYRLFRERFLRTVNGSTCGSGCVGDDPIERDHFRE
jgi:hypothetical protein